MEAQKLQTVVDLQDANDGQQRIELIDGEIVKRPMARSEHALTQSDLSGQFFPLSRRSGSGGWWIMTEISVRYNEHHCPVHDLAGWCKERVSKRPTGIMDVLPDWVCEITSPGHERKDTITHLLRLQANKVPYYWLISPEDKTLIVYALENEHYRVAFSMEYSPDVSCDQLSIPPFEGHPIDLGFIFGVDED
ncbi:MAG: Uma2 family endonuclease [Thiolinea sp.]